MIPIISALIPVVISLVGKILPAHDNKNEKHAWVQGFFQDGIDEVAKVVPAWIVPELPLLKKIMADAVQAELDKVLPL